MNNSWVTELQSQLDTLPLEAKVNLKSTTSPESCLKLIELARSRRKGYDRLLLKLRGLIEPIKRFENVIDVLVQVNSGIASPLWGPLRMVFGIASERLATLENVTTLLERLTEPLLRFQNYERLFQTNTAVQTSICKLYSQLIRFCAAIIRYHSQSSFRNVLSSFDKEFREVSENIRHCWTEVDIAANAANIEATQLARAAEASDRSIQIRKDVLRWLCPVNVQDDFRQQSSMYTQNSFDWIFENDQYKALTSVDGPKALTILGRPGEGKTLLATFIIEYLSQSSKNAILYFFCKAGDPEKRKTIQVIRTILAQLLRFNVVLSGLIEEIYYNNGNDAAQSLVDVVKALKMAIFAAQVPAIYIVIDGIDECQDNLDLIQTLLEVTAMTDSTRLVLCSRDHVEILDELEGRSKFLRLDDISRIDSIRAYTWQRVSKMRVLSSQSLQEWVVETVCVAAQGLWLYARLVLDEIQHLPNTAMIEHQLRNIPRGLRALYSQILISMASNLSEWELRAAQQIFLWVDINDYARINRWASTTLRTVELALEHISMGVPVHDPFILIERLGAHMIDVYAEDDGTYVIDFIHHTTRQYIQSSHGSSLSGLPSIMAPRRLRELHCGATAAWYFSDHYQAKLDLTVLRESRGYSRDVLYFETAYALWGALRLAALPTNLEYEEYSQLAELCNSLQQFLSSEQCLTWVEMAILINYGGGFSQLMENVEEAIRASSERTQSTFAPFEAFRKTRLTFFMDYAYVICETGPAECSTHFRHFSRMPPGFSERSLAQKLLQIGTRYSQLRDEVFPWKDTVPERLRIWE